MGELLKIRGLTVRLSAARGEFDAVSDLDLDLDPAVVGLEPDRRSTRARARTGAAHFPLSVVGCRYGREEQRETRNESGDEHRPA